MKDRLLSIGMIAVSVTVIASVIVLAGELFRAEPPADPPRNVTQHLPEYFSGSELEQMLLGEVNEVREGNGLTALSWDSELAEVARGHSRDMEVRNYFDHVNLQGEDASDRARRAGYNCTVIDGGYVYTGIAENLVQNNAVDARWVNGTVDWKTQEEVVRTSVDGWMESESHRENILDATYSRVGYGVAIDLEDYSIYVTQNFC